MKEVSKFIPMEGNEEIVENAGVNTEGIGANAEDSTFRVCANTNLPVKPTGIWGKIKAVLLHEIKVELTPEEQKVEDELNDFLHQEITWKSFKDFLFQDVEITYGKKRV